MTAGTRKGGAPQNGFTLVELLIVIAIIGALAAFATPAFTTMAKNNRLRSQANEFHLALMYARSEALNRISRVTVCKSSDGAQCATSGDWEQGWIVFLNPNNNATVDTNTTVTVLDDETILRVDGALTGGNTLIGNTNLASRITFAGTGETNQAGTLVVCDDRGFINQARAIAINAIGRARVIEATATHSSIIDCNATPSPTSLIRP